MNNYPYNNQNNYQGYYGNLNQPKKKNKSRSRSPRNDYKVPSYNQNQGYPQKQYYQNPQNPQYANYGGQYNYSNYPNQQSYRYNQNYGYQGYNYGQQPSYQGYQGYGGSQRQPAQPKNKNDLNSISNNLQMHKRHNTGGYTYNMGGNMPGGPDKPGFQFVKPANDAPMRNFSFGQSPVPGFMPGRLYFLR